MISDGIAIAILGVRAVTLMGFSRGVAGVVILATLIMSATLVAANWKSLQGIVLTSEMLGFFIAAIMLIPQINAKSSSFWGLGRSPSAPARRPRPGAESTAVS